MTNQKPYTKDLTKITSVRLSPNLLDEGIQCADSLGISLSDFIRQSIMSNIHASMSRNTKIDRQTLGR